MRDEYHRELGRLGVDLQALCELAANALERATQALLNADLTQAEQVISDDLAIDEAHARFERAACSVLALQAPVAGELRSIVGMIQVAQKVSRMGDLARHVAEAVRRRHPSSAVPERFVERFVEMGALGVWIGRRVGSAIVAPAEVGHGALDRLDDRVDELEAEVLALVSRDDVRGDDVRGDGNVNRDVQAGIDVALLARYYERFADQAVSAARRLEFIATGA